MALTVVPVATSSSTSKQIAVAPTAVNQTIYTVPSGKTFTGNIVMWNSGQALVNGVQVVYTYNAPNTVTVPVTLVAGSVIASGSSYISWALIGVEQ